MDLHSYLNILYLLLVILAIFVPLTIFRRDYDRFILIAFAIGSVVSSNIYTSIAFPINIGSIPFGIDSILYTVFIFCVAAAYFRYGLSYARTIAISSIVAIIISAFFELFAYIISNGFKIDYVYSFILYLASVLGTIIGMQLALYFIKKRRIRNVYLNVFSTIVIASIANSIVYFGVYFIIHGFVDNFIYVLIGSSIAKLVTSGFALLSYYITDNILPVKIIK